MCNLNPMPASQRSIIPDSRVRMLLWILEGKSPVLKYKLEFATIRGARMYRRQNGLMGYFGRIEGLDGQVRDYLEPED